MRQEVMVFLWTSIPQHLSRMASIGNVLSGKGVDHG